MPPVLTSISPASGPPGTLVNLTGSGFTAASQVGCPSLQATTFTSATSIAASIPEDIDGAAGGSTQVAVFAVNDDGSTSTVQMFTVEFPDSLVQAYATVKAVAGEVPGFVRGGQIDDDQIQTWIRSASQAVNAALLRRGFSLDASTWAQPQGDATPDPTAVLERVVRLGAAVRLASACASLWGTADWAITRSLTAEYQMERKTLESGGYDHLFAQTGVATEETGPSFAGTVTERKDGTGAKTFFEKGRVF